MTAQCTIRPLLNPKSKCHIGTGNVRTMFQTGKTAQVEREMLLYRIHILGISECGWTGNGYVTTSLGNTIVYLGRNDNDHREGVAIMMSKEAKKSMIEWTPISERRMVARFKSRYTKLSVIQCYTPTNDVEEETKDTFYQQLQKALDNVPSHDVLLVIGDLNAKVGRSNEVREKTMGKNGCGEMNDNGERLADICGLNDLVIGGTIFEHKEIHKLTLISPDGNFKNQIDHVFINGRWKHSLHNVTIKRGADVGSDHHLLLATVKLQLRRNPIKMAEKGQRYNIARLRNPDVSKNFSIAVKK